MKFKKVSSKFKSLNSIKAELNKSADIILQLNKNKNMLFLNCLNYESNSHNNEDKLWKNLSYLNYSNDETKDCSKVSENKLYASDNLEKKLNYKFYDKTQISQISEFDVNEVRSRTMSSIISVMELNLNKKSSSGNLVDKN